MSLKIKSVEVIKRTNIETGRPTGIANTLGKSEEITVPLDETYDFSNPDHRRDILMLLINRKMREGAGFYHMAEEFMGEVRSALQAYKDELPFT